MMARSVKQNDREAGFTLIETIVALALDGPGAVGARQHHRAMAAELESAASTGFSAAK